MLRGDLWEENAWYWLLQGADLCWTVPKEEVLATLGEAEAALAAAASASGSATLRARAAEEAGAASRSSSNEEPLLMHPQGAVAAVSVLRAHATPWLQA